MEADKEMDRRDRGRRMKSPSSMDSRSRRRDSPDVMMQQRPPPPLHTMPRDSYNDSYNRPKPSHCAYKILCVGTKLSILFLFNP